MLFRRRLKCGTLITKVHKIGFSPLLESYRRYKERHIPPFMVLVCRQVHEIESLNGNVKIMTMSFDDVRGGSYLEDGFTIT